MADHFSDFLLISGADWEEVPNFTALISGTESPGAIQDFINSEDWYNLSGYLESVGVVPENGPPIVAAKLYVTGDIDNPLRFWIIR